MSSSPSKPSAQSSGGTPLIPLEGLLRPPCPFLLEPSGSNEHESRMRSETNPAQRSAPITTRPSRSSRCLMSASPSSISNKPPAISLASPPTPVSSAPPLPSTPTMPPIPTAATAIRHALCAADMHEFEGMGREEVDVEGSNGVLVTVAVEDSKLWKSSALSTPDCVQAPTAFLPFFLLTRTRNVLTRCSVLFSLNIWRIPSTSATSSTTSLAPRRPHHVPIPAAAAAAATPTPTTPSVSAAAATPMGPPLQRQQQQFQQQRQHHRRRPHL